MELVLIVQVHYVAVVFSNQLAAMALIILLAA
jgi:hypothetical protein